MIAIHDFLYFPKGVKSPVLASFTLESGVVFAGGFTLERGNNKIMLGVPRGVVLADDDAINQVRSAAISEFNERMMEEA